MAETSVIDSCAHHVPINHQLNSSISTVIRDYLNKTLSLDRPKIASANKELEAAMLAEMKTRNFRSLQLEKTIHLSASLIELAYHGCTFSEKLTMAKYNWYLIYVDDTSSKDIIPSLSFQQRFIRGLPQLDPVLDALAGVLHDFYNQYDTVIANAILNATFDFITTTCIEPAVEALTLNQNATRFPWFFRARTGVAVTFALMMFPKSRKFDFGACFLALPDMDFWISATNDLLSFYKEELAGETANYISNRASVEAKPRIHILSELKDELFEARKNILVTLARSDVTETLEAWLEFEHGYVLWHLEQSRYKLAELNL